MTRILMVCLGNICRSPLAEGVMRHKIEQYRLDAEVDSAGTAAFHTGEHPDPRSTESGLRHGIDISKQHARRFDVEDFDRFDLIFVMDQSNYRNVLEMARGEDDKEKVDMLMNAATPDSFEAVPDPYYGGEDGFEMVYQMIDQACEAIAKKIQA